MENSEGRGTASRPSSFASRKARGEVPVSRHLKGKEHGYDARNYHQNVHQRGIQALRSFDCPVCESKNTVRIDLNSRLHEGTVRCTYCMSLRPIPSDLPYPYTTRYIPSLENKADVFFKFSEKYQSLLQEQGVEVVLNTGGGVSSNSPHYSGGVGEGGGEEGDGLLGGLDVVMEDDGGNPQSHSSHPSGRARSGSRGSDGDREYPIDFSGSRGNSEERKRPRLESSDTTQQGAATGASTDVSLNVNDEGDNNADEVDVAAFFDDSD